MFNSKFNELSTAVIVKAIKENGFFCFEEALSKSYIDSLLNEIDFDTILLNTNDVGVVRSQAVKYLTHCLANSKHAYDVITSKKVIDVCSGFFTDSFKLTNHRVYETSQTAHMPWHTDNNRQIGNALSAKHVMPGLLFLVYLSDVEQNAFQFIKNSHKWSGKYFDEIYLSDKHVDEVYNKEIISFKMKRGAIIISDINGIHRAEPFKDKSYKRTTLLFQVDQTGLDNDGHGEKNIVNTEFLSNLTPEVMDYLGFGFKRDYPAFPSSSLTTLSSADVISLQKQLIPKALKALTRNFFKAIIPSGLQINYKRMKWNIRSKR